MFTPKRFSIPCPMAARTQRSRTPLRRWGCAIVATGALAVPAAFAQSLAIQFVDSPARASDPGGSAMNARGDIVGRFTEWPCGNPQQCAPVTRSVVWRAEGRLDLPTLGALNPAPTAIADDGMVAGRLTDFGSNERAVVWRFVAGAYQATDLGLLPGTTTAAAVGVDATGRVIGHAQGPGGVRPFYWTAESGLVDLANQGFPAEAVAGVSRGGVVATARHTYQIDDPASVRGFAAAPAGYQAPFGYSMAVNNLGDVATFLATTTTSPLFYLFRYHAADGRWQLLSGSPNGNLSFWNVGSIDDRGTVTATVTGNAVIAQGPEGLALPLASRLSPAYGGVDVPAAGERRSGAGTLATAMIGRSPRLVRLVGTSACSGYCLRVATLAMTGRFVNDPRAPGSCTPAAENRVKATLTVTDADGNRVAGASVRARFLDDYALNTRVSAKTNAQGQVVFNHRGPACVGAVALLVDTASAPGGRLDRSVGTLTGFVIPLP